MLSQANQRAPQRTDVIFALVQLLAQAGRLDQADSLVSMALRNTRRMQLFNRRAEICCSGNTLISRRSEPTVSL